MDGRTVHRANSTVTYQLKKAFSLFCNKFECDNLTKSCIIGANFGKKMGGPILRLFATMSEHRTLDSIYSEHDKEGIKFLRLGTGIWLIESHSQGRRATD